MKTIQLTQGQVTLVDDEDYDLLSQYKWYALRCKNKTNKFYAITTVLDRSVPGRRQRFIKMHRFLMNLLDPKILVDHKDGNSLNNQKANLRISTNSQNVSNSILPPNQTGYIGVYFSRRKKNPYKVTIMVLGKHIALGNYNNVIDAAKVYDIAAKKYHGEFAKSNF